MSQGSSDERLLSLDAYRGLIMLSLAFNGFGLEPAAKLALARQPDSSFWKAIKFQFSHVDWVGCSYWDMIQPSFMFMVGVSMAYSYVRRIQQGASWFALMGHAGLRAVILVFLGIFLISNGKPNTDWSLMNVLTQIGLGYVFLFLLWRKKWATQMTVAIGILIVTCLGYWIFRGPGIDLPVGDESVEISSDWAQQNLQYVPPAWHKNANLGHRIDLTILNWLPHEKPFAYNRGGYQTINFIPALATMIFGLMIGELLRSDRSKQSKLQTMLAAAALAICVGLIWSWLGCPLIKRLWTPSWALFSSGICIAILAAFYWILDIVQIRWGVIILTVFGVNSIAVYVMYMLLRPWTAETIRTHLGQQIFASAGEVYQPILQSTAVGICFWLVCFWMYRQRVFVRI